MSHLQICLTLTVMLFRGYVLWAAVYDDTVYRICIRKLYQILWKSSPCAFMYLCEICLLMYEMCKRYISQGKD